MTDRAAIVARITALAEGIAGRDAGSIAPGASLEGDLILDSMEAIELAIAVEDEFFPNGGLELDPEPHSTVNKIADAVVAAMATTRT